MIYKNAERALSDGCIACNQSAVACDAGIDLYEASCCALCQHPETGKHAPTP